MKIGRSSFRACCEHTGAFIEHRLLLLQKKFDEEGAEACMTECTELVHVRTAGPEEYARWAERRACWRWGRYPPPGHGDGTQLALQEARGQVLL